jgi:integrase
MYRGLRMSEIAGLLGLRHTFASSMLSKNVNIKVIQEQLGPANIRETLNTYSHIGQDQKKSATKLFNSL